LKAVTANKTSFSQEVGVEMRKNCWFFAIRIVEGIFGEHQGSSTTESTFSKATTKNDSDSNSTFPSQIKYPFKINNLNFYNIFLSRIQYMVVYVLTKCVKSVIIKENGMMEI